MCPKRGKLRICDDRQHRGYSTTRESVILATKWKQIDDLHEDASTANLRLMTTDGTPIFVVPHIAGSREVSRML